MDENDYVLLKRFKQYFECDQIIDIDKLKREIATIYGTYKIKQDMPLKEAMSQQARLQAYLTALKKRTKRDVITSLVYDIVKYYKIEKTTYHFFFHICSEFLGRSVDNRYILEKFSNMVSDENFNLKKIESPRNASEKLKLDLSFSEFIDMGHKGVIFEKFNFRESYNAMLSNIENIFDGFIKFSKIENHEELDALLQQYEIEKIIKPQVIEEQETQPIKKRRL